MTLLLEILLFVFVALLIITILSVLTSFRQLKNPYEPLNSDDSADESDEKSPVKEKSFGSDDIEPAKSTPEQLKMIEKKRKKRSVKQAANTFGECNPVQCIARFAVHNRMAILTLVSVVLAVIAGYIIRHETGKWSKRSLMYLEFPGEIFLRMLKVIIIPLIVGSLISALGNLDFKLSGNIGKRAIAYYLSTTVLAIILGIFLVLVISPGSKIKDAIPGSDTKKINTTTVDTLLDLIRNLFPPNLVEATFHQYKTKLNPPLSNPNETDFYKWTTKIVTDDGTNIIGLVFYSIVFGIIISQMKAAGKPLLDFFVAANEVTMKLCDLMMGFTPIGVFFLVIPRIISVDDMNQLLASVGLYALTVLVGLFIHGFIFLPVIYYGIVGQNPYHFICRMMEALVTAFGTASSSATLPVTINCLKNTRVDNRVVRFVVPIGATINMDGTALYEAVAVIFIAQLRNIKMDLAKVLIVSVTATAASIGAAGIPSGGLATMIMVLNSIGLPADDIALIFVIDWLLDRFRTAINVLGDAIGAAVVGHLSRDDLKKRSGKKQVATSNAKLVDAVSNH